MSMAMIAWLGICGSVALYFAVIFVRVWFIARRYERTPLFPIHEWMSFATSFDGPMRDEVCALIQRGRYPFHLKLAFVQWHQAKVRGILQQRGALRVRRTGPMPTQPGVYVLSGYGFYKIGYSSNIQSRLNGLNTASPYDLIPLYLFLTDDPQSLEQALHAKFAHRRIRREWFQLDAQDLLELKRLHEAHMQQEPLTHE